MFKGKVKDFNSRAVTVEAENKYGELKDILIFNKELNVPGKSFLSPATHPDIIIGNEVDINISKNLTAKDKMLTGELIQRYEVEDKELKERSIDTGDLFFASISRVESTMPIKGYLKTQLEILNNFLNESDFKEKELSNKIIESSIDKKRFMNKDDVNIFLLVRTYIDTLPSQTKLSREALEIANNIIKRFYKNNKRCFATILDENYFGLEVSFWATDIDFYVGNIAIVKIIPGGPNKLRAELVAKIGNHISINDELPTLKTAPNLYFNEVEMEQFIKKSNVNLSFEQIGITNYDKKEKLYVLQNNVKNMPSLYWRKIFYSNLKKTTLENTILSLSKLMKKINKENDEVYINFYDNTPIIEIQEDSYKFLVSPTRAIEPSPLNLNIEDYSAEIEMELLDKFNKYIKKPKRK